MAWGLGLGAWGLVSTLRENILNVWERLLGITLMLDRVNSCRSGLPARRKLVVGRGAY